MELRVLRYFLAVTQAESMLEQGLIDFGVLLSPVDGTKYEALDKLINVSENSSLCFRPLEPTLETRARIVWKKRRPSIGTDAF